MSHSTVYDNPYAGYKPDGAPPPNPAVTLPIPNDNPTGKVVATATATTTTPSNGANPGMVFILVALVTGIVLVLLAAFFLVRRRKSV